MTSEGSKTRIKWEGDSNRTIREWPEDARRNIGADLQRLDEDKDPLDAKPLGSSAPGISELRDEHMGVFYRLLYGLNVGWIYVLHCFEKKTNQTPPRDLEKAINRFNAAKLRK